MNQSIKKNYILNTAYQILALLTPLITAPYISRVLGAEGVGIYSFTSSVAAVFSMFAMLGTTTYGQRAIAQIREDKKSLSRTFWEIECVSLIAMCASLVAWFVFILAYPSHKILFVILTLEILSSGADISWFYSGLERFTFIVFRNSAIKISGIVLLFLLVKTRQDLWIYLFIMGGSRFLGNLSMWVALRRFVDLVKISELQLKDHLRNTLAYFIPTIASSVYNYLDKVMIGVFTDTSIENGFYEQAQKIVRVGYTIIISLNTVMSSRMSYLFAHDRMDEIKARLEKSLAFILTFSIPIVFGICAIAKNFVPWFYGDEFEKVILLLYLSSPLVVILSLHNFLASQYLIPSGQRVRSTKGVLIGAGTNFMCNLILIPRFQSVGAIIATLIAESSICVTYYIMSREIVSLRLIFKYVPKQIIASGIMAFVIFLIGKDESGSVKITIIQIAVGIMTYFVLLLALRERFFITTASGMAKKVKSRLKNK